MCLISCLRPDPGGPEAAARTPRSGQAPARGSILLSQPLPVRLDPAYWRPAPPGAPETAPDTHRRSRNPHAPWAKGNSAKGGKGKGRKPPASPRAHTRTRTRSHPPRTPALILSLTQAPRVAHARWGETCRIKHLLLKPGGRDSLAAASADSQCWLFQ